METLNKKQREILKAAHKVFPDSIPAIDIPVGNYLSDFKILEEKGLITANYSIGSYHPVRLTITSKGIEKLRETFITRLQDTAWKNPWAVMTFVVPVVISVIFGLITWHYYSENLDLQNQIKQENDLKQIMPPTASLRQDFEYGSSGELVIIPTLYFKKNSEKLFTIFSFQANFTLNGKQAGDKSVGGYPLRYETEELPYNVNIKSAVSPTLIDYSDVHPGFMNYSVFFHNRNDLIIDYILEIKDMDSQIRYRGNVTTEIDSTVSVPKSFPSGYIPIIFNWTKV